jgi:hypothetical protein
MTRSRALLTLILVAITAMLVGLAAASVAGRRPDGPAPGSRPEATEPQHPPGTVANV